MAKCNYCGYILYPLDKYCPECGADVSEKKEQQNIRPNTSETMQQDRKAFRDEQSMQQRRYGQQGYYQPGEMRRPTRGSLEGVENDGPKWVLCKLIFGIISICLFFVVSLQSCAAGIGNALSNNGEVSGTAGFLCALLYLIAGIVGLIIKKSGAVAHAVVCGFYYFLFFIATALAGSYSDLKIWGVLGFIFGAVFLFSAVRTKKGYIIGIIVSVLIFAMGMGVGSVSDSSSSNSDSYSSKEISVTNETSENNSSESNNTENNEITVTSDVSGTEDKDLTAESGDTSEVSTEASSDNTSQTIPTIDETVILDNSDVVIKAVELVDDSFWGPALKLNIENNSDKNVNVGCSALIVNDYMIMDLFASEVAAGKKTNENLNLFASQLKAAGIDNIGKIEMYLRLSDSDSYDTIYESDCITIETSEYANMDVTANDSGKEIYNDNGIRVVAKYVDEDSFWGKSVLLYLENNRSDNVSISVDDMSINGYMVNPYFSSTVYAGKKAINDITLMSSDLESNGITSVDEIELAFEIRDADTYSEIVKTEPISFTTN